MRRREQARLKELEQMKSSDIISDYLCFCVAALMFLNEPRRKVADTFLLRGGAAEAAQLTRSRSWPRSDRFETARLLLPRVAESHRVFVCHEVVAATGDGLCFLHSALLQLCFDSERMVWQVAAAFLEHLAIKVDAWKAWSGDEFIEDRERNLARCGILREVDRRNLSSRDRQAYCYVLDRCCGVACRDWGTPRLYCDGLFLQLFAEWLGCSILLIKCDRGGQVEEIKPENSASIGGFALKMVHYESVPEHFDAICNPLVAPPHVLVEKLQSESRRIRASTYWNPSSFDVHLVAQDVLPSCAAISACSSDAETNVSEVALFINYILCNFSVASISDASLVLYKCGWLCSG